MKIYEGERGLSGAVVTVDGKPLDPKFAVKTFSKTGFEWTYAGVGPRQLGFAILADHLGNDAKALELSEAFTRDVIAFLDNAWRMDSAEIDACLTKSK